MSSWKFEGAGIDVADADASKLAVDGNAITAAEIKEQSV